MTCVRWMSFGRTFGVSLGTTGRLHLHTSWHDGVTLLPLTLNSKLEIPQPRHRLGTPLPSQWLSNDCRVWAGYEYFHLPCSVCLVETSRSFLPLYELPCFQKSGLKAKCPRNASLNTILRNREECKKIQAHSGFRGFPQRRQTYVHRFMETRMLHQPRRSMWLCEGGAAFWSKPRFLTPVTKFLQMEGRITSKDQFSCLHSGHPLYSTAIQLAQQAHLPWQVGFSWAEEQNPSLRHLTSEALEPGSWRAS